ncbi:MAG TPA: peroxide stress protein YaaA [Beutenbergiaceae bacterium]|nr:peroxide stress protein YaaA [Beutenbergiaceae bacterium]
MLILLPPSENKRVPARGRPVDLGSLVCPELSPAREQVLHALTVASARPDATDVLKVSSALADQVAANTGVYRAATAPAAQVYQGVLYEAAGLAEISGTARRRANRHVRIASALWGILSPNDRIPAYRLSMTAALPGVAPLAAFWARHLTGVFDPAGRDVVVDCRSGAYAPAWSPARGRPWITVRVVAIRNGRPKVVSHHAKHARGVLAGHLLRRAEPMPRTVQQVLEAASELVGTFARDVLLHPAKGKGPDTLEIVLAD